jgi:uncharacterized pyridoxamine 5'-phosphate oxidase family protein
MSERANIERVKQLMSEVGTGFLATTDGTRAAVRPMSAWVWDGPDLICATFRNSDKTAEIAGCAAGEYCIMDGEMNHVRISGALSVEDEPTLKARLYEAHPVLQQLFKSADDPGMVYLRMKVTRLRWMGQDMEYVDVATEGG